MTEWFPIADLVVALCYTIFTAVLVVVTWKFYRSRKSTIDWLLADETSLDNITRRAVYISSRSDLAKLKNAVETPDFPDKELIPIVLATLNKYEIMAIGIFQDTLDEGVLRRYFRSTVLNDWNHSKDFIHFLRTKNNNDKLFSEFEALASRWSGAQAQQTSTKSEPTGGNEVSMTDSKFSNTDIAALSASSVAAAISVFLGDGRYGLVSLVITVTLVIIIVGSFLRGHGVFFIVLQLLRPWRCHAYPELAFSLKPTWVQRGR